MSVQSREVKVLAAFLASLTAGVIILMALGNDPPSAGAFCLSGYYGLESVEKVIFSELAQPPSRWGRIVVYYSGTEGGNVEELSSLGPVRNSREGKNIRQEANISNGDPEDITCHFVVCNGSGGADGQIQPTQKWRRQCSIIPGRSRDGSGRTIHICVIADGKTARPVRNSTMRTMIQKRKISNGMRPTDLQIRRVEALTEALCREFNIEPGSVHYPNDWQ